MSISNTIKIWAGQIRAPFLLLAVILVLIGGAVAHNDGRFNFLLFSLCLLGAVLAHASVNIFNELSDHRTGIDNRTRRTPFSGGSGTLQAGHLTVKQVTVAAWGTLLAAFTIGVYLTLVSGWMILVLAIIGGLVSVFYTSHITRFALGELASGICLGSLVVVGTYYAMTGQVSGEVILVSIPPGLLTALLLFLNEFPDLEADKAGGRKHLLILLGRKKAAVVYVLSLAACYFFILLMVLTGAFPAVILISLLTVPLAVKAARTTLKHHDAFEEMIPAQGANVGIVLGTDLLIAIAYFIH
ncbi:MAG: prenyltransferase [bacterium]